MDPVKYLWRVTGSNQGTVWIARHDDRLADGYAVVVQASADDEEAANELCLQKLGSADPFIAQQLIERQAAIRRYKTDKS